MHKNTTLWNKWAATKFVILSSNLYDLWKVKTCASGHAVYRGVSAGSQLLKMCVRIPQDAWICVCCERCVLSGRGLCDELITSPEESYRLWCVVVCDLDTSRMRRPWPSEWGWAGLYTKNKQTNKVTLHPSRQMQTIISWIANRVTSVKCNWILYMTLYCLTYLLTPWCKILLEKLTGLQ